MGRESNIKSIRRLSGKVEMMDMGVSQVHCFYANGVLVRNCGQEISLAANFSHEPVLLTPIKEGRDVHMHVAKTMFGYENPDNRTKVKGVNFQKLYGGTKYGIAGKLGISVDAAGELLGHYDRVLFRLKAWMDKVIADGKKNGYVYTYFKRPIAVFPYFNSSESGKRSYGARLAVNATVQGCIPATTYIPDQGDGMLHMIQDHVGDRVMFGDASSGVKLRGVPSFRGTSEVFYVVFNTGDFMVCTSNHKFVKAGTLDVLLSLDDAMGAKVGMVQPHPRQSFWSALGDKMRFSEVCATVGAGRQIKARDPRIAFALFKAWVKGDSYSSKSWLAANAVRSVVDLYGYNLMVKTRGVSASPDGTMEFVLKRSRSRRARVVRWDALDRSVAVMSPSMITGYQTYPLSGFVHKNTGGDLIRLALVKFFELYETDPEWAASTRFQLTVHDEVNFLMKPGYLKKGIAMVERVMNFHPKDFEVPVRVDVGVSPDGWGNCLDICGVTDDNRIIPKGWMLQEDGSIVPLTK